MARAVEVANVEAIGIYMHIYQDTFSHVGGNKYTGHTNSYIYGSWDYDRPYKYPKRATSCLFETYRYLSQYAKRLGCFDASATWQGLWQAVDDMLLYKDMDEDDRCAKWKKGIESYFDLADAGHESYKENSVWGREFYKIASNVPYSWGSADPNDEITMDLWNFDLKY